jgi:hypothetical protein
MDFADVGAGVRQVGNSATAMERITKGEAG